MSKTLFPIIQPELSDAGSKSAVCREVAWDYKTNSPIWRGGSPYIVTGAEAVASWAYRALQVARYRYEIYSWNYGNECEALIGTSYSDEMKEAEAKRYVFECLITNKYITDVSNIKVEFLDGKLMISCVIKTIYGEVNIDV